MDKKIFILLLAFLLILTGGTTVTWAQEQVEVVDINLADYNPSDVAEWEINIFSLPAFALLPHTFRHIVIAIKTNDGKITTKSLYPERLLEAAWGVLINDAEFMVDAIIKTNAPLEAEVVKKYYNNQPLPFEASHEYTVEIPEDIEAKKFIETIFNAINYYPIARLIRGYNALYGPNSNTFVDDVLEAGGVSLPNINKAVQQNWGEQ